MNWLDWIIVAILVLSALRGLRSGLLKSVSGLAGVLIGLFVAFAYHRAFASYLSTQWNAQEKIQPLVENFLKNWLPTYNTLPKTLSPGKLTSAVPSASSQLNHIGDNITGMFASGVLEVFSFLVLLLATVWAASLVGSILTRVADISFLGLPNHLGGFLFGAARGIIIVMIILALMSPFQRAYVLPGDKPGSPGTPLPPGKAFQDSLLLPYFNPIFNAIKQPLPGAFEREQNVPGQDLVAQASNQNNSTEALLWTGKTFPGFLG